MSELAVRSNGWGVVEHVQPAAPAAPSLSEWVEQAREVATIADMLCRTSFVPKAFQGKPAECAAAVLAGQEMGMSPMASLRAIDVIEGRPGLSALGLRAQVQSKGHEIWTHESTATRAIVKGRRKGSDKVETSVWTIERAKTFGLTGKKNWREQPTAMLLARATSECARLIAADALLGMPYSTEELADGADAPAPVSGPPAEAQPAARRTARRAQPAAPEPKLAPAGPDPQWSNEVAEAELVDDEPAFDDEPEAAPAAQEEPTRSASSPPVTSGVKPEGRPITDKQKTLLHTLASKVPGLEDRDAKLLYVSQQVGREVESTNDLTMREAALVIAALERAAAQSEPPMDGTDG